MPSVREQIRMTDEEVNAFIGERFVMQCATIGPRGFPHMVPLWYVPDGLELSSWTYAKSQKARNLERDPRATVGIEEGVRYEELRGVMFECAVELERDSERVTAYALRLAERYGGASKDMEEAFRKQAPKRVGLRFRPQRIVSWDHRKLGGIY